MIKNFELPGSSRMAGVELLKKRICDWDSWWGR